MAGASESGYTLVEVLVATAVASTMMAGAVGLLAASARAVREGEVETAATLLASSRVEVWRSAAEVVTHDRADVADGTRVVEVLATEEPGLAGVWRVQVTVTGLHLRQPIRVETLVTRGAS